MKPCRASRGFQPFRLGEPSRGTRALMALGEISKRPASFVYSAGGTMKVWNRLLLHVAWSGLIFSSFHAAALPAGGQQAQVEGPPPSTERASLDTLPDSPGTTRAQTQDQSSPANPRPESEVPAPAPAQGGQPPASPPQSQSSQAPSSPTHRPVCTAYAY